MFNFTSWLKCKTKKENAIDKFKVDSSCNEVFQYECTPTFDKNNEGLVVRFYKIKNADQLKGNKLFKNFVVHKTMNYNKLFIIMALFGILGCKQKEFKQKESKIELNSLLKKNVNQTIFGEEVIFNYSDFEDLKSNKHYDKFEIDNLVLPTGKVVCADPLFRELGLPQTWTVKPGKYPVSIYIGLDNDFEGRVAYAEIIFSFNKVKEWKMSLISEEFLEDDFEKKMNGMYPVEAGLSSFSDYSTWKKYCKNIDEFYKENPDGNFYNDKLEKLFKKNVKIPKSSRGEDWLSYKINDVDNIIMFGSGWGDGLYPRYIGYDKNNIPVKLITDFIQLEFEE